MQSAIKVTKQGRKVLEYISGTNLKRHHARHINEALQQYGAMIVSELKRVISTGTRSGRVYYYRGEAHTASAPGEPPANISGKLMNSFEYKRTPSRLAIFSELNYAPYLELGTEIMKIRPYFVVTNIQHSPELHTKLQKISEEL